MERDLSGVKGGSSTRGRGAEKDKDVDSQSDDSEDDEHSDISLPACPVKKTTTVMSQQWNCPTLRVC